MDFLASSAVYTKNDVFLYYVPLFCVNMTSLVEYYAILFPVHERKFNDRIIYAVELHLSGTPSHQDTQKIRIIGFFFENKLHSELEFRLLLFTVCTCV
jgi:hypothetical protein